MDGEQIVVALAQTGAQISVEVAKLSVHLLIKAFSAAKRAVHKVASQATQPLKHGQISVRALQKSAGGDVRHEAVSPELISQLKKELKAYGVDFSVTSGADGKSYVHFSAKDMPAIEYALEQTHAKVVGTVLSERLEEPAVDGPKKTPAAKTRADVKESIEARAKAIKAEAPKAALSRSMPVKGAR